MKWFTSDWHLGHDNVLRFSERPFKSTSHMNEQIIANALSVMQPGDELYFLGDLAWRGYALKEFFDRWPKSIPFHWVLGNHDKNWQPYKSRCASITDLRKTKIEENTVVLCHYPMLTWDRSHYNSWMLFGHHHRNSHGTKELDSKISGKTLNVDLEFHDYLPYSELEIAKIMAKKSDNWDLIVRPAVESINDCE